MCHDFAYIFDTQAVKGWQIIFNWGKVAGHLSVRGKRIRDASRYTIKKYRSSFYS